MKSKNGPLFFILLSISVFSATCYSGCANIVPPLGGPKDTIPPVLVSVLPRDSSRHIPVALTSNKIVFNFNEYIDGKDIRTELLVNPVPKIDPIVDYKLRVVTVRLKDTLQPNTTYSLNFGKGIKDVNEDNIRKNFSYVFSTGNYIDSGQFAGNVILAASGKVDSTLIVVLNKKLDDSSVVKDKPRYVTRVDTTGHFFFDYLKPGTYAVYALKDEGGTRKYLSRSQLFAFADSPIVVRRSTPSVTLYAYAELGETKTSSKSASGSSGAATKPSKQSAKDKEKDKRLQFQTNINAGVFDVLDTMRLAFPTGLKTFDSTRIRFTDENFHDIGPRLYVWRRDSTNKKFFLFYAWAVATKYNLIFAKDFAQDSAGRRLLKIDTIAFRTKKDIEYGEVRIRIFNLNLSKNPVLQFVQADAVKFSFPFKSREFRRLLFAPGEYQLRVLYDDNKNGVWDPGEFFGKHRQPEKVIPIRKKFTVKANWDNDYDVTL
jgi:uncharacterized protein (DUF2141 family)